MKKIQKHEFEAVSLLTVENGLLDLTIIPAVDRPDWLVPTSLVLSIDAFSEHIWTYLWRTEKGSQAQEVMVYRLLPNDQTPNKIVVIEGNTDVHRLGLLIKGELRQLQVRISDVKDVEGQVTSDEQESELDYIYQLVEIDGAQYVVPDVDTLAHRLVDLDS